MTSSSDPLQHLNTREKACVAKLEASYTKDEIIARLHRDLQIAVEIELATLPVYLYTYYSINRLPTVKSKKVKKGVSEELALFANKAGGIIMSVAVEEMLHMSLSCNILYALGRRPKLYRHSPNFRSIEGGGTNLPFHTRMGPDHKPIAIKLTEFNLESMWAFLEIEYRRESRDPLREDNWVTIGDFYSYIRCLLSTKYITDEDFTGPAAFQLSDDYYAQNCIDTIYPGKTFAKQKVPLEIDSAAKVAHYPNSSDSHAGQVELVKVINKKTALQAIATICDQGEGFATSRHPFDDKTIDDPSKKEQSHYDKFLQLQAQLAGYDPKHEAVAPFPAAPKPSAHPWTEDDLDKVRARYPENPVTEDYPQTLHELSNLCNGIYQYMLLMSEAAYTVSGAAQVELFNVGMHKAMIWILDKLIQGMRGIQYPGEQKSIQYAVAPTFENIDITSNGLPAKRNVLTFADNIAKKAAQETTEQAALSYSYTKQWAMLNSESIVKRLNELPDIASVNLGRETVPVEVKHACMGLNACKGQGRTDHDLPPNDCAGQGACYTANTHSCHTLNECKHQGGCGLYGTTAEQSNPGGNDCKGHGSCATPINAERFATADQVAGKSVWRMARHAFEERMKAEGKAFGNPPEAAYQEVDGKKVMVGPSNQFLTEHGCYSACGSSGMSGGGSCS